MEDNRQDQTGMTRPPSYNVTFANARAEAIRDATIGALAGEHVPTILYVYYGTFALQVARMVRIYGGGRMQLEELKAQMHLWHVRGLDPRLLAKLAYVLFGIPAKELLDDAEIGPKEIADRR